MAAKDCEQVIADINVEKDKTRMLVRSVSWHGLGGKWRACVSVAETLHVVKMKHV